MSKKLEFNLYILIILLTQIVYFILGVIHFHLTEKFLSKDRL